jgi:hypothetical protein
MFEEITQMDAANLAALVAVWAMGLAFLALSAKAICGYLKNGR